MQLAMIEDRIVPFEQLDPAYLDRGTFFGDGVYEVMRSYNGRLFAFEEHMQRFAQSLAGIAAVVAFGVVLGVAEVVVHLRIEGTFDNLLFELGKYARLTPK